MHCVAVYGFCGFVNTNNALLSGLWAISDRCLRSSCENHSAVVVWVMLTSMHPPLSRESISRQGLAILDEYGLADVTMRRVASALGVAPGALYWHISNKQELIAGIATLIIAPIARPRLRGHSRTDWINVLVLGLCLGGMNTSFYFALGHLPYGVAVTVEFLGPLTLAALGSRSWRDVVAIIMALLGVAGVSGAIGARWSQLSLFGIGMALLAGLCWALYAKAAQRVGGAWRQLEGLWFAMVLCTLIQLPLGIAQAGTNLLHPATLLLGLTVAILSSALPYSFEMYALRRISTKVYGIIVGFEPMLAALAGLVILHQRLTSWQIGGMALVIVAGWLVLARERTGSVKVTASDDTVQPEDSPAPRPNSHGSRASDRHTRS